MYNVDLLWIYKNIRAQWKNLESWFEWSHYEQEYASSQIMSRKDGYQIPSHGFHVS